MTAGVVDDATLNFEAIAGIPRDDQRLDPLGVAQCATRRVVDAAVAGLLLLVLLPLFVLIVLAIKLTSSGPAFYTQRRIGRHGVGFSFIKFRTMVPDADAQRATVLGTPDDDMPERYRHDPRITAVGRVLRRWSVDELPQLVNVLRGDMALVGPRPILPEELALLEPHHHVRHACRPGLTGLWQISGRKDTTWQERMALDVEYVRSQSLPTDARIIGRTLGVVLTGEGAY